LNVQARAGIWQKHDDSDDDLDLSDNDDDE